ncbi:galanin receptor 2b-like [Ptychodera flava]|uniref:galanin receptor 2b-like n=1 Tax=Ptychodera flava TaxID=63121 RepID=UPI00396A2479
MASDFAHNDYDGNDSFLQNGSSFDEYYSRPDQIIMPVLFSVIFAVGLIGNVLVMVTVIAGRGRQNTTNIFITNLAVADLLLSIFCTPFMMTLFLVSDWIFSEAVCKLNNFLYYCTMLVSVFTMVAMSMDRYLAVVYPIRTMKIRTPMVAIGALVVIWTLSIATAMPYMMVYVVGTEVYPDGEEVTYCTDFWPGPNQRRVYNACIFVIGYLLPFLMITVIYLLMLKRLWSSVAPSNTSNDNQKAKKKVTQMVMVVVLVFGICWLPHHIITMWSNFDWYFPYNIGTYVLRLMAMFLSAFNSCVNPLIYAFMSESFRKNFKKALTCYRRSNRVGTSTASTQPSNVKQNTTGTSSTDDFCSNEQV